MTTLDRWQSLWRQLGATNAGDELFQRLVACYAEPHRRYHTMQHLAECFALLDRVGSFADRVDEVELALWFHDAIYNPRKNDNENRSAEWAREYRTLHRKLVLTFTCAFCISSRSRKSAAS